MSLTDGLIDTVFLTFAHNQDAIGYFFGIIVSVLLLFYKPSRTNLILLIGFIFLLFGFEYNKHIIAPLEDQTISSIGADGGSAVFLKRIFQKLLPVTFFIIGWGGVLGGMILQTIKLKKHQSN
jgi:hypothetical protein